MPHKDNADCRHHIPRPKRRVTNWSEYNEALRQRGSLTVWFTDDAIAAWKAAPRTTPGGQLHYSDLAITTALTLRAVFRLALRQTEGLIGSILQLLGLDLSVPDYSTWRNRSGAAGSSSRTLAMQRSRFEGDCSPVPRSGKTWSWYCNGLRGEPPWASMSGWTFRWK